ncbi:lipopolysaccharide export system/ ATPase component [Synechococcus sp. BIOS-E4-1]|nr:lipopolysaccharide export system/ ATPase component [Synechococcus sp. BIOS-E4-1]
MLRGCLSFCAGLVLAMAGPSLAQEFVAPLEGPPSDDGLITIESDSQTADNITGVVTAIGNVRIVYPSRGMVATSRQAQYFSREGRLVLSGDVDVVQEDGSSLRAERVTYNLEDERAVAVPPSGEQVRSTMILRPDQPGQTPLTP